MKKLGRKKSWRKNFTFHVPLLQSGNKEEGILVWHRILSRSNKLGIVGGIWKRNNGGLEYSKKNRHIFQDSNFYFVKRADR